MTEFDSRTVFVRVRCPDVSPAYALLFDPKYIMTVKECREKLVIIGGYDVVFKRDLEQMHKKFGTSEKDEYEAELYRLMDYDCFDNPDEDMKEWFRIQNKPDTDEE